MFENHKKIAWQFSVFTAAYAVFFFAHSFFMQNFEFMFYSVVILVLLAVLINVYRRFAFSEWIIISLSIFGLLHLAGGNIYIYGVRLYDFPIAGNLFHFDNVVHTTGIFLTTIILYNLISPFIDQRVKDKYIIFYFLLILMALGIGSLNEIIELIAVLYLRAGQGVGNYLNNAFDIVFNAFGSTVATVVIHWTEAKRRRLKLMPTEQQ